MKRPARYYPALLRLAGRKCLVVGGGTVALRKVRGLLQAGAQAHVVSREFCAPLSRIKGVRRHRRAYRASDLRGAALVICATDDEAVNRRVAHDAAAAGLPVNVVDRPALCSFIVPASVRRGRLTITISTHGASPALAARIRRRLGRQFGPEYSRLLDVLVMARRETMKKVRDPRRRRRVLQVLASPRFVRLAKTSSPRALREAVFRFIRTQGGQS